jgi:hypothetical protein
MQPEPIVALEPATLGPEHQVQAPGLLEPERDPDPQATDGLEAQSESAIGSVSLAS